MNTVSPRTSRIALIAYLAAVFFFANGSPFFETGGVTPTRWYGWPLNYLKDVYATTSRFPIGGFYESFSAAALVFNATVAVLMISATVLTHEIWSRPHSRTIRQGKWLMIGFSGASAILFYLLSESSPAAFVAVFLPFLFVWLGMTAAIVICDLSGPEASLSWRFSLRSAMLVSCLIAPALSFMLKYGLIEAQAQDWPWLMDSFPPCEHGLLSIVAIFLWALFGSCRDFQQSRTAPRRSWIFDDYTRQAACHWCLLFASGGLLFAARNEFFSESWPPWADEWYVLLEVTGPFNWLILLSLMWTNPARWKIDLRVGIALLIIFLASVSLSLMAEVERAETLLNDHCYFCIACLLFAATKIIHAWPGRESPESEPAKSEHRLQ